jgi:hypothetical protein
MEIGKLATALHAATLEIKNPTKNKHVIAGAKDYWYSDLPTLLEVKPILHKHNLILIQTMRVENGQNILMTSLVHTSGEHIESEAVMPSDLTPQQFGTVVTYYRRYQISAILSVASEDDLDGDIDETPTARKPQPQPQATYNDYKPLEVGEIVPSWWWDLMKSDKKRAMSLMPKGCKYEKNAQNKWVVVTKEEEIL